MGGDIIFLNNLASLTADAPVINNPVYVGGTKYSKGTADLRAAQGRTLSFDGSLETGVNNVIRINQAEENTPAVWSGMVKFTGLNGGIIGDAAEGSTLSVAIGGGTVILESGLSGRGTLTVAASAALYTGSATRNGDGFTLLTGLENFEGTLTVENGATLGTNIINRDDTAATWYVNRDELNAALSAAFAPLIGNASVNYAYRLTGNVAVKDVDLAPNESLISGTGSLIELGEKQPDNHLVLDGGTIDASLVSSPDLNGNKIAGGSGTLITTQDQIITYTESNEHGYDVIGAAASAGGAASGASIIIGTESCSADLSVVLSGSTYATTHVEVCKGTLQIGEKATVGTDGITGTVAVGRENTTARLINNGTIKNDVIVGAGSSVHGSGRYEASVVLGEGS